MREESREERANHALAEEGARRYAEELERKERHEYLNSPEGKAAEERKKEGISAIISVLAPLIFGYFNITQQAKYLSSTFGTNNNVNYIAIGTLFAVSLALSMYLHSKNNSKNRNNESPFIVQYIYGYCLISIFAQFLIGFYPETLYFSFLTYLACFRIVGLFAFGLLKSAAMLLVIGFIVFLILFFSGTSSTDIRTYFEGIEIHSEFDDWNKLVVESRKACDLNDAKSCTNLGIAYAKGFGVTKDIAKAASLYKKGCDRGSMVGCYNLAGAYSEGIGVKRDIKKAFQLLHKACQGNEMTGCFHLGIRYQHGLGVTKSKVKAAASFKKSCDGGNADACRNLETLYE